MKLRELLVENFAPNQPYYHVGPDFEQFSMAGFGRGENNHLLGHGIYFINSQHIAKGYAKYSSEPVLYTVHFNAGADQFYNNRVKPTDAQMERYNAIANEMGYAKLADVPYNHSLMKYGRGLAGAVFEKLGTQQGGQLLAKHGVVGQIEEVDSGIFEVAVYDMSIIQIDSKEPLNQGSEQQ